MPDGKRVGSASEVPGVFQQALQQEGHTAAAHS
jgi:hypothetical protein